MLYLTLKHGLRLGLLGIFVCLIFPPVAVLGDVVYVKDGREIKGQTTQKDDKVIISLPDGKTVTVDKTQILHIAHSSAKGKPKNKTSDTTQIPSKAEKKTTKKIPIESIPKKTGKNPTTDNKTSSTGKKKPVDKKVPTTKKAKKIPGKKLPTQKKVAPPVGEPAAKSVKTTKKIAKNKTPPKTNPAPKSKARPKAKPPAAPSRKMIGVINIKIKNAARPESFLYMLLRRCPAESGSCKNVIKDQIVIYRMLSHERKRKIGEKWFSPCDFKRHRHAFVKYLKKARGKFREAKKLEKKEDTASKKKRKGLLAAGRRNLTRASQGWADPVLRIFLLGLTKLQEKNYTGAESCFRECILRVPHIAAFHQARAQALLNLKRDDDALRENTIVLKLMPNSREALGLLQQTMKKVSGSASQRQNYKNARSLVKQYTKPVQYKPQKNTTTWLFPGKKVRNNSMLLPVLPFDRIELRQGVAVAVGHNVLAVDIGVVSDAQEIFLRTGSKIIPGRIDSHSLKPGNRVAFVYFYDCKFTPIKLLAAGQFKPELQGIAYTMNIFREMGSKLRAFPVSITKIDGGNVTLSAGVAPGEGGGPVIDAQGQLLGFLSGKIDPEEEKFPEKFYSVIQLRGAIDKITKRKSSPPWRGRRNVKIVPVSGKTFLVEVLSYEKLSE